jgi:flavin reductase (DIM6/NTAB) family NADH-FMN oxidoreductase RutF
LRRLAKAVAVITASHEGQRYAMAATAVNELSMDPPSMLVCVNRSASLHAPLAAGADFCINILHCDQERISRACSGTTKGEARFAVGAWGTIQDIPILLDAQASIVCKNETKVCYGTHELFLGPVVAVRLHGDVMPLVYLDGRYTRAV